MTSGTSCQIYLDSIKQKINTLIENEPEPKKCLVCGGHIEWNMSPLAGEWHDPGNYCESCIVDMEKKRKELVEKAQQEARIETVKADAAKQYARSGIAANYIGCSLENFQTPIEELSKLLNIVTAYRNALLNGNFKNKRGLFLGGKRGTGKTHLAVSVAKEAISNGIITRFENYPNTLMKIKSTFGRNDKGGPCEADMIKRTSCVPFLIIDDIGKEIIKSWSMQTTYLILNERESSKMPMIITSNLKLNDIANNYDAAIASRIAGACHIVDISDSLPDWRMKNV